MNRLRNRLIVAFLAATAAPLGITLWLTASLLEHSLSYSSTRELDEVSRSLEKTGREFYRQARESLKNDAAQGRLAPRAYAVPGELLKAVQEFWESGAEERFLLSGERGERLEYLVRRPGQVLVYTRSLGEIGLREISEQYTRARSVVEQAGSRDLRRGFLYTFILLAAGIWLAALGALVYSAHRISKPIQALTRGLAEVTAGNVSARVEAERDDEVGQAIRAFNEMAGQLERSRERLAYLSRLEGWQKLARKMAHELKNSLTPIRLTMEEMLARSAGDKQPFLQQAAQIVADEVNSLERRVRAFTEFGAEPPVRLKRLDGNALLEERISFLRTAHPEIRYETKLEAGLPEVSADEDLIKGVLTNLLENAAAAAGPGGQVVGRTKLVNGTVAIEVHDSGPGLSAEARASLFEPAISFKKGGMGLGLSIARRSALLCGGDIVLVKGELGGAAFRVLLKTACEASEF